VVTLGIVLLIMGFLLAVPILWIIGMVLVVVRIVCGSWVQLGMPLEGDDTITRPSTVSTIPMGTAHFFSHASCKV
jgi:hypothetical protein